MPLAARGGYVTRPPRFFFPIFPSPPNFFSLFSLVPILFTFIVIFFIFIKYVRVVRRYAALIYSLPVMPGAFLLGRGPNDADIPVEVTSEGAVEVEILSQPSTARQLSASASSVNTALTATCRRISMRAVSADIRYAIGATAQTASAASHFIANGERLDLAVPLNANIAVIRNAATDGVLEVTELI